MKPTHNEMPPGPVYFLQNGEPPYKVDDDKIDLLDLWRVVADGKWLITIIALLTTVFAAIVALNSPSIYRAEVVLVPAEAESKGNLMSSLAGQFGGLVSLAGIDIGKGGNRFDEIIAVALSRQFTEAYVKEKNLMPVLFSDMWDSTANRWLPGKNPPTLGAAHEVFKRIRTIVTDKKTGLTTLTIEWTDPHLAAEWANELVIRLNQNRKLDAIREAKQSIAYLEKQLEETSVVETRQAIYKLIEAQTQRIMLANVREQFAFKVIDPAVVPDGEFNPKRSLLIVMGLVGGLMLGFIAAFLRSYIRNQRTKHGAV